jgi:hypothetical protein
VKCAAAIGAALVAVLALGEPRPARAQETTLPARRLGVSFASGPPTVTFSARDLASRAVRRKLQSGLPQTLIMRVYAYRDGSTTGAIAVAPIACRVVYDLWDEVYRLEVQTDAADRSEIVSTIDAVLERCLTARRMPVGTSRDYRTGSRIYFATLVELNPLSPDTVQRIRRWLARPSGGRLGEEAFFGSFVSLFVNRRIGDAERTVRFRSQSVVVP